MFTVFLSEMALERKWHVIDVGSAGQTRRGRAEQGLTYKNINQRPCSRIWRRLPQDQGKGPPDLLWFLMKMFIWAGLLCVKHHVKYVWLCCSCFIAQTSLDWWVPSTPVTEMINVFPFILILVTILYRIHSLSSHCRLKWPKSDFFAQMWPISDFLMTVWTAQIRCFQIRPRPLSYVVLNRMHIWCFAMQLQSERPCRISCDFYVIEMRQTSQFCAGGGGNIKITIADNI